MKNKKVRAFDTHVIGFVKAHGDALARASLTVIFFWFGFLKLIDKSPANDLVRALLEVTMPNVPFAAFIIILGILEVGIGLLFMIEKTERLAILLLIPHMIATFLPLVLLPEIAWQSILVPTLEGQYIIKNMAIIALAAGIMAHLHPVRR